ncbi:type III polyketide synthase [Thalassobacillus sp. CUG 92003]|uniref:type III polyketide synthase n=1 Tax=Thalassobacillus sp. CUG 92003 TaxID=2736641 RepID=UPI0015E73393|nr:3-oxoacyl-[acyl-carrier-protein] synthase III C-terminal domain-containing protein [Thalassobacillus sp. CUG 92003]
MSYILSVGTSVPAYNIKQDEVKRLVEKIFPISHREFHRLAPVFDHTYIKQRFFSASPEWLSEPHGFKARNDLYKDVSLRLSLLAIDRCLQHTQYVTRPIKPEEIDMIMFVSSTGVTTPTLDASIINQRTFREDTKRMPLFGLGCAGGASGVARAHEWLKGQPEANVLVICVELCSLTFQNDDARVSNFIGTALFGDGVAAVLVCGDESNLLNCATGPVPKLSVTSSKTKKDSLSVMGWDVLDTGFKVIFNKSIPQLVHHFWKEHVDEFLKSIDVSADDLTFIVAHPGGRKVLEAYQEVLGVNTFPFKASYHVLKQYGNMSSATVLFVLDGCMQAFPPSGSRSFMMALGPGFSSELIGLEWV